MERVGGRYVLARIRMRHHGEIGEPRLLRHQILLAAGDRGEAGGGAAGAGPRLRQDHVVLQHESVEHRADGVRPFAALLLGGRHHLLDHRAGQALAGQRCHVAAVHAHMQRGDVGVPVAGDHQAGGERRLAGGSSGQGQQQLADGHGTPPRLQIRAAFLARHEPVTHHMADGCEVRCQNKLRTDPRGDRPSWRSSWLGPRSVGPGRPGR